MSLPGHGAQLTRIQQRTRFSVLPVSLMGLAGSVSALNLNGVWQTVLLGSLAVGGLIAARYRPNYHYLLLPFVLFFLYSSVFLSLATRHQLSEGLNGTDVRVTGRIVGLPTFAAGISRFDFEVDKWLSSLDCEYCPRKIRLAWYRGQPVETGQLVSMDIRIKVNRGYGNPGSFDTRRWALSQGYDARGYVKGLEYLPTNQTSGLDKIRSQIADRIRTALPDDSAAGVVQGLSIGFRQNITDEQWQLLRSTGTSHLVAISGLHIGMLAALGAGIVLLFYRLFPALGEAWPRQRAAVIGALLFAGMYALLAGLTLPTQRALIMLTVAALAILSGRRLAPGQTLASALLVVLMVEPLAPLSNGFWLSFMAVAVLIYGFSWRRNRPGKLRSLLRGQVIASVGLLPLGLFLFGVVSIVGPLANLFAIPWAGLVMVPLSIAGSLLSLFSPTLGQMVLYLAAGSIGLMFEVLAWLSSFSFSLWQGPAMGLAVFALVGLGSLLLLSPARLMLSLPAVILMMSFLVVRQRPLSVGEFEVTVIDVGQGLSVYVRTRSRNLLYDTGPSFRNGGDSGERIVVPFLQRLPLQSLDMLIVSHGDDDHSGGADSVIERYSPAQVLSSDMLKFPAAQSCWDGHEWQWDGVDFKILNPPPGLPYLGNDSSCVLRVASALGSVLLTGDISDAVELRLQKLAPQQIKSELLIIPHHGSKTSSSVALLGAVSPRWGIFSTGFGNRFNMPHKVVTTRYEEHSVETWDTAVDGAVSVAFVADEVISPRGYRNE